jgi:hypothetical protein
MVAKVRQRLSVSKQASQKFEMGIFNLKKLNDMARKYCRFATLKNLGYDDVGTIGLRKVFRNNMKASATESVGYCKLGQHNPWLHKERSRLMDQGKLAKLQ